MMDARADLTSREKEARDYLVRHKIPEMFDNLTASLVFHKPTEPNKFCLDFLLALRQAKSISSSSANPATLFQHCPVLFDDSNIESVFRIIDPETKGYITHVQSSQAMTSLGIPEACRVDMVDSDDLAGIVCRENFMRSAKIGLAKATATFASWLSSPASSNLN